MRKMAISLMRSPAQYPSAKIAAKRRGVWCSTSCLRTKRCFSESSVGAIHVFEHGIRLARDLAHVIDFSVGRVEILPSVVIVVDETVAPARAMHAQTR